ncbi:erythromycin esterase family protein [Bacteroides intestinalis]|nr:erythromycin esterase family protein [Bacteroides intestinalis]
MKKTLIFFSFVLQLTFIHAQSFSNLGFEYWQANKYPLCWTHPAISVTPDSIINLSGKYSLKGVRQQADVEQASTPYGLILQDVTTAFNYSDLENGKISVSVQIKSKAADSTMHIGAFVQIIDKINPKNNNIVIGNDVAGREWAESSATLILKDITPASNIYMGVIMMGYGEIWLDNYQIKLNGELSKEISPRTTSLTEKEKEWLSNHIISFSDDEPIDGQLFGKALPAPLIVGIGDNVHGSSSIIKLKNRIAQALIEYEGFTLITIEDSPEVGEAINKIIQGGSDTAERGINIMYENPDFINFTGWLRKYNKSVARKVRVFGVDVNSRYEGMIEEIDKGTFGRHSQELDSIRHILKTSMNKWEKIGKLPFNEKHKKYLKEKLESIKQDITSMKPDKEQEILLCYYADHLLHYLSFDAQEREKQMADNISRLHSLYPDEKIIYMAHNLHVGNIHKGTQKTGSWLKERFQDQYYIIGTCYYDGTDCFKKAALSKNQTVINESVQGSYEYLFNQITAPCFFLDLNRLHDHKNASNEWLHKPMLMRNYGVEPFNYYYEFTITDMMNEYDGVLFIKKSMPL